MTAALFRKRLDIARALEVVKNLSKAMRATICIPSYMPAVLENATKPSEVVCVYSDASQEDQVPLRSLNNTISRALRDFRRYTEKDKDNSFLLDSLHDLSFLLKTFGVFGAFHGSDIYLRLLDKMKARTRSNTLRHGLNRFSSVLKDVRQLCSESFDCVDINSNFNRLLSSQVLRLFEVLKRFDPTQSGTSQHFTCIVFVERRSSAYVLYHLIKEASKNDEKLRFVRPNFTMGQASKGNVFKESDILGMKQREIMKQFREGQCNLLVATSVLEEGIDFPDCNVIIRFDPLKNYCEYVQSKGRARCPLAFYILMINHKEVYKYLDTLAEFHGIEQVRLELTVFSNMNGSQF